MGGVRRAVGASDFMDRWMTLEGFLTPGAPARAETRVRGSTFLALAAPAPDEEEARSVLAGVQKEHSAATHNCSAWRLHGGVWRANDAGEPSGSAGVPILGAIDAAGVMDCVVVVTRYFGGTKLGVGGLVRAYSEAAALALDGAPLLRALPAARFRIRYPYEYTSPVMRLLERSGTYEVEHGYSGERAEGEVLFTLPAGGAETMLRELRDASGGRLTAERLGERILYTPAADGLA